MKTQSSTDPRHSHTAYVALGTATIAIAFIGFTGWAALAPISSAAISSGRIEVETATKPVQHLEGGLLSEILVSEGARVKQGDVLFKLQPIKAQSTFKSLRIQLDAERAAKARMSCEIARCATIAFPEDLLARANDPDISTILRDQKQQRRERAKMLNETIAIVKSQLQESIAQRDAAQARASGYKIELDSLDLEINRLAPLVRRGTFPRNKHDALKRSRARLIGNLNSSRATIQRHIRSAAGKRIRMQNATQRQHQEISKQLSETNTRIARINAQLKIAEDAMNRVDVRAAKDGVIQNIKVTMRGEVVPPRSVMAEIVPVTDKLVVGAKVAPRDIDSVAPGNTTQLRVRSFSASRTPSIVGRVRNVSADTVKDEETQRTFYKVKIEIDRNKLPKDLEIRLLPGMPVDVIIAKGERTVLEYLMDPLLDAFAKSMRET